MSDQYELVLWQILGECIEAVIIKYLRPVSFMKQINFDFF